MSAYRKCSDWAAEQYPGSPEAKLILMMLAFDVDKGAEGSSAARIATRTGMSNPEVIAALQDLERLGKVDNLGNTYAPRWQA